MAVKWMNKDEAYAYLAAGTEGRLATVGADGQPYITPLNYVFYKGKLYFHSKVAGRKLTNLAADSRVCFETSHTDKVATAEQPCKFGTRYSSVLVFGKAQIVDDPAEKQAVLQAITDRFANGRPCLPMDPAMIKACVVVHISIDSLSGKRNVDPQP